MKMWISLQRISTDWESWENAAYQVATVLVVTVLSPVANANFHENVHFPAKGLAMIGDHEKMPQVRFQLSFL